MAKPFQKNPEPVIAFRNAIALCMVLPGRTRWPDNGWIGTSWSDTFDYHPAQLRLDGSAFDLSTPALNSIGFRLEKLSLTPDLGLPRNLQLGMVDDYLGGRLARAWLARYWSHQKVRRAAMVFRSLETAYQAASVGFKNYASLTEVGMDAVYWTNAIEVLAMPQEGSVNKWHGANLVRDFDWSNEPELTTKKYRYQHQTKAGKPRRFTALTLGQKIFLDLYEARSKFVHGDRVSRRLLLPFGDSAPSVLSLASTIYRLALHAFLQRHWPAKRDIRDLLSFDFSSHMYRKHLLAATPGKRARYAHEHDD